MVEVGTNARADLPLAVVVGAGGLGMAIARRLGERYRLLLADRDANHLARMMDGLRDGGYDAAVAICDVTDPAAVSRLREQAHAIGPPRVLAHVVGLSPSMGDARAIMSVDLVGAALVEEAMLAIAEPGTAAIFISSLAAHGPPPSDTIAALLDDPLAPGFLDSIGAAMGEAPNAGTAYSYAKWALNRRCRQRAAAWGRRGARIVSLSPGLIATPMGALEFERQPAKYDMLAKIPVAREGTMQEIADAVEFLASDRASYISGIDLLVDGGLSAAMQYAG